MDQNRVKFIILHNYETYLCNGSHDLMQKAMNFI